jgi:hypothetical protein
MVDAPETPLFVASPIEIRPSMRTIGIQQPDVPTTIAKRNKSFTKNIDVNWRGVRAPEIGVPGPVCTRIALSAFVSMASPVM